MQISLVFLVCSGQGDSLTVMLSQMSNLKHNTGRTRNRYWWQHHGQTFAHVQVVVRAELSACAKTEEKYISGCLHKTLEKKGKQNYEWVNSKKLSFNTRKILRNSLPYIFRCFLIFCVFVQSTLLYIQFAFIFPALF